IVQPGRMPTLLPALDTLWLELVVPSFYCMALSDSVPEFVPAPQPDPAAISRVQIFYSFEGDALERRQTGLLTVQLDPALIAAEAPEPPRSEEHTSELQSRENLVCRLLLEKKKKITSLTAS